MADCAMALQVEHKLCMYKVSEMVGGWMGDKILFSLGPKQRPPSLK